MRGLWRGIRAVVLTGALGASPGTGVLSIVIAIAAVLMVTLVGFVLLFTGYAQSTPRTP